MDVAPVAAPDEATTPEDTAITIAVLSNDEDADGNSIRVKTFDATSNGKRIVKLAVDELCLAVKTGEVFGLLSHRP